jgi:peptidyl-prolyl cis-trans isomerase SurA
MTSKKIIKMNKIILSIVACCISLTSFAQVDGVVIDKVIAVVGNEIILKSDLESQVASYKAQGVVVDQQAKCEMFEEILFQKLLLNQANIDSVTVSSAEVEGEINRRMNYFIAQIGSEKKLEQYYKKSIIEIKEEFRIIVKDQMVSQRMQGQITSGIKVTPKEVKSFYNDMSVDSIPMIESEVEYAQILIYAKESTTAKDAAKTRLEEIRERIINGESFSTLAILYSEDEGSAKKGGELGFMGRAELVPEFSIAAFNLKKDEISNIVETQFGFHIIQLIERRGQKSNVRHILIKVKVDEKQVQVAKNLADSVYNIILSDDTLTFGELAGKYSNDEQTMKSDGLVVNRQTGTSIFSIDQVDPQIYYSIDKMKPGEVSEPVPAQTQDGKKGYRIIKLLTKTEPHKATLNTDYSKIQNAALGSKNAETVQKWIADKTNQTYIKIEDEYKDCDFSNTWIH